jgi:hypothetical protein
MLLLRCQHAYADRFAPYEGASSTRLSMFLTEL